ncbi:hypothetical protein [Pseudonocardia zijingensis]|uniref:Lipoprotein n=1 Tax=Pseudonocardia zijingensis TaxID=153376 RepID=A0ABP3ZV04_9PSEU
MAEPGGVSAARILTALALVAPLLVGCTQAVAGSAAADPAVVARLAQERECRAAGDAIVTAVRTVVQRVDNGGLLDGSAADAMIGEVPITRLGSNLSNSCGPELVSAEYSRILVEVDAEPATTFFGRIALNAAIIGLCRVEGTSIVLDERARRVCVG